MRLVINNCENVVRIILAQSFQLLQHAVCCVDDIGTAGLINLQRYRLIAVNTATFIGQKRKGIAGGILATLGIVFPSLVIISILAGLITNFSDLVWVQNAFAGIQVCVCVLIFNAVIKLLKKSVIDKRTCVIFLLVMTGGTLLSLSPVWFVLLAALAGIVLKNLEGGTAK